MSLREWTLIFVLGIGWGSSFFFNEILLREVGPITVACGRIGLGAVGCWLFILATRRNLRFPPRVFADFMVMGMIQFAIPFSAYSFSQENITSGAAGIINALTPVLVVVVSHFWVGGERATKMKSLGVLLGFLGILFLVLPAVQSGHNSEFWGLLLAMLAPVFYAISTNFVRRLKGVDPATLSAMAMTAATLVLVPLTLINEGVPVITRTETWASFAIIGFVLTSASFIALFWLIRRIGATNTSIITFIAPVSAVLLGVGILGEQVLLPQLLGMGCIFLALLVMDGRLFRRVAKT